MNFKKVILLVLSIFPLVAFSQNIDYIVEGKVNATYNGRFVKLIYTPNSGTKKIDSTQINGGEVCL
ncbi:hypothetical protein [Pedobacter sp. SL55]|uniref:hypothetical protein n=1 Tax=Pedobacter sp. SL55 TaxID=2995161 RepID=UPI002270C380|nr:hypothetical protein [Pedobacter sp. SL55]WAC39219.1 hypothetical protein OVA16_11420 [Pedobacter sp. SL55]